jgi:hypothetical protein
VSKGLPHVAKDNLEKCGSTATAAVDAYNRPGPRFRTPHYIILIVIAWTALFHAVFRHRTDRPLLLRRRVVLVQTGL